MSIQAENERLARALHAAGRVPLPHLQRLSPDGTRLLSGARDPNPGGVLSEVRLWDRASGEHLGCLELTGFTLSGLAVDLERRLVALGGRDGSIQLWSLDALSE